MIVPCPHCGTKNRVPEDRLHLQPKCGRCGKTFSPLSSGQVVELDDQNFAQITGVQNIPVLVDFYSPTCGPCQSLAPVITNLAAGYAGKAIIAKLDTSRHQMAAAQFQIRGVPTLLFFKNGQMVDQLVGAAPQAQIEQRLQSIL